MALQISLDDEPGRDVALTRREGRAATLWIDGREHRARLRPIGDGYEVCLDDRCERMWLVVHHDDVFIHAFGRAWRAQVVDPAEREAAAGDRADVVTAPMPGTVVTVAAGVGDPVNAGQPLVVIESMKMHNEIVAWRDGIVQRVHRRVGETFDRGAALVELEPAAGDGTDRP